MKPLKKSIAVIGFGAIAEEIIAALQARNELGSLVGVLVRPCRREETSLKAGNRFPVVDSLAALFERAPQMVVEAAGHDALAALGAPVLDRGIDLLVASVGALANREVADSLMLAASDSAELWIPSGAVAGVDGLLAARTAGLRSVRYTSLKPPAAWVGTRAQTLLDPAALARRTIFFTGSAREAAAEYRQNANVAATIALAGLGLDATEVRLGADPELEGPLALIEAQGAFGTFRFEVSTRASSTNPKTSAITGHSLASAILDGMCFRGLPALAADRAEVRDVA